MQERGVDSGRGLPSTSMAAQAVDEFIESMDLEKYEDSPRENGGADHHKSGFSFVPSLSSKVNATNISQV